MIFVERAYALLTELANSGKLEPSVIEQLLARHPRFQNISYPLALPPLLLDAKSLDRIRQQTESYVELLEKVIFLYRRDPEVRAFFGFDRNANKLIEAEGDLPRAISICRLDGYVKHGSDALQILENNADCPAGTLFTTRLNRVIRELVSEILYAPPLLPMDNDDSFIDTLVRACSMRYGQDARIHAVVLQPYGLGNVESEEIAKFLRKLGYECSVVDPRVLQLSNEGLIWEGQRIDLVWNKINTSVWNQIVADNPEIVDTFTHVLENFHRPIILNSFSSRYIAEAKTSLAIMHDPRFSNRFLPQEKKLIEELIPWTTRLDEQPIVKFDGKEWVLADLLRERQFDLVIKQQYDIRGEGVTIGRDVSASLWHDIIASSWGRGAVAQRYVTPERYPVQCIGFDTFSKLNISLDCFVFDGKLVGLGAKASNTNKVNLFQGGTKLAVIVVEREK